MRTKQFSLFSTAYGIKKATQTLQQKSTFKKKTKGHSTKFTHQDFFTPYGRITHPGRTGLWISFPNSELDMSARALTLQILKIRLV